MKPDIVIKTWGHEKIIENGPEYCGKLLCFKAGGQTSMHFHRRKLETMYLQSGKVLIRFEDRTVGLDVGEKIQIQRGEKHQIIAVEDSELFECSTQDFSDDSFREPATALPLASQVG